MPIKIFTLITMLSTSAHGDGFFQKNLVCDSDYSISAISKKGEKFYPVGKSVIDLSNIERLGFFVKDVEVAKAYVKNGISFHSSNKDMLILNDSETEWTIRSFNPKVKMKSTCVLK